MTMATQSNLQNFLAGGLLKIFSEGWEADVLLKAGDTEKLGSPALRAHKLVLAARSEVFKKMLESDEFKASSVGKIEKVTLSELKHEALEAFIEFIYSDGSMLSVKGKKRVRSLFVAADKYDIPHLRDLCRNELISSLKTSNAVNYLKLSLIPYDKDLNDAAARFVIRNLTAICETAQFKVFVGKNPDLTVQIIKSTQTRMWNGKYIDY